MSIKTVISSDTNWGNAGNGTVTFFNEGTTTVNNWTVTVKVQGSLNIQECWNASFVKTTDGYTFSGKDWNKNIASKQTVTSGFSYTGTGKFTFTTDSTSNSTNTPTTTNPDITNKKYKVSIVKVDDTQKTAALKVTNISSEVINNIMFEITINGLNVSDCKTVRFYKYNTDYIIKGAKADFKSTETREFVFTFIGNQAFTLTTEDPQVLIVNEQNTPTTPTTPSTPTTPTTPSTPTTPTIPTTPTTPTNTNTKTNKKVMGYVAQWDLYDRKYPIETIPGDKLTHIMYAFCLPNPSQEDFNKLKENYPFPPKPYYPPPQLPEGAFAIHDEYAFEQQVPALMALKQKYPHLKICISLGGWTLSWTMSKVMSTPSLRTQFIKSSVDAIIKYGFDGFDLDWEYPGKQGAGYNVVDEVNDKVNVATFFKELQKELQTRIPNKHIELSVASGANKKVIEQYKESIQYLDYFNLMTYDFYGSWGNGGHLSGLYQNPAQGNPEDGFNIDAAVTTSLTICPKEKLCIGVPFYARGWQSLQKDPNNPDAPIIFGVSTQGPGVTKSQNAGGEPGLTCWKDLRDFIGKNNNIEYFDEVAKVPYVHNSITGETWSYDNPKSIQYKMQYLKEKDLAGLIIWQLSDDVRDSKNSLLDAINLHLKS